MCKETIRERNLKLLLKATGVTIDKDCAMSSDCKEIVGLQGSFRNDRIDKTVFTELLARLKAELAIGDKPRWQTRNPYTLKMTAKYRSIHALFAEIFGSSSVETLSEAYACTVTKRHGRDKRNMIFKFYTAFAIDLILD